LILYHGYIPLVLVNITSLCSLSWLITWFLTNVTGACCWVYPQSGSCCSIPKCSVLSTIVCLFILFTCCYCLSFFASRLLITPLIYWALFMHMDYFDIIFYLRLSLHRVTSVLLDTKWKAEESTTKKFKICQIYKEFFGVYCFDIWWLMSYLRCACSIGIVVSNTYCVVFFVLFVLVLYLVYCCV
jgi:hypothetical protein